MSSEPVYTRPGAGARAASLFVLVVVALGLLLLGYVAFPSFLAWWMLIAAFVAALVASLVYGGRRPALVLPAMVTFTFVALLAEYLFLIMVLAPRLN